MYIKHKSFSTTFLHNRLYVIEALNIYNISHGKNVTMRLETQFFFFVPAAEATAFMS